MTCCYTERLCHPDTGKVYHAQFDYAVGVLTIYDPVTLLDVTSVDYSDLVECERVGDSNRADIDYCGFDVTEELPPRQVTCDGDMIVSVTTLTPPLGGDETFTVLINGANVGTVVLSDGEYVTSGGPWTVAAGDVVTIEMTSSTATTPSGLGSVALVTACGGAPPPPPAAAYLITEQPTGVSGEVGDPVDLGGGVNTGGMQWQTATSMTGPWSNTTEPTGITTEGTVYYRFCADDGVTCSNIVAVTGTAPSNLFDPTTATGEIGTQGNNITDENGDRIWGGAGNAGMNQRTSGA